MIKVILAEKGTKCFLRFAEEGLKEEFKRNKIAFGTFKRYDSVITKLADFAGSSLPFHEFDYDFLKKYEGYLLNALGNGRNTLIPTFVVFVESGMMPFLMEL